MPRPKGSKNRTPEELTWSEDRKTFYGISDAEAEAIQGLLSCGCRVQRKVVIFEERGDEIVRNQK